MQAARAAILRTDIESALLAKAKAAREHYIEVRKLELFSQLPCFRSLKCDTDADAVREKQLSTTPPSFLFSYRAQQTSAQPQQTPVAEASQSSTDSLSSQTTCRGSAYDLQDSFAGPSHGYDLQDSDGPHRSCYDQHDIRSWQNSQGERPKSSCNKHQNRGSHIDIGPSCSKEPRAYGLLPNSRPTAAEEDFLRLSLSPSSDSGPTIGVHEDSIDTDEDDTSGGSTDGDDLDYRRGDWNARFQKLIGQFRTIETADEARDQLLEQILDLSNDFINTAKKYATIIILERFLPCRTGTWQPAERDLYQQGYKTIEPVAVGGQAGGEKFIVGSILFKFAVDTNGLLGSDWAAAKMAGLELLGHASYFNLQIPGLHFPLTTLVDYMGYRVIAMSLLPINRDTIIYGTNDGGRTIHSSNPGFDLLMAKTASALNIRPHICGIVPSGARKLHSVADLEGHRGFDDRFYLLDFARSFPPTKPDPSVHQGHLYQLFRPEFLQNYPAALCPDAYSGFVLCDPDNTLYNESIDAATEHLFTVVIPRAAKDLQHTVLAAILGNQVDLEIVNIPGCLHRNGVNLRFLGRVLAVTESQPVRILLLVEAVARVLKNDLRNRLRRTMARLKIPLEAPYRALVVKLLNRVFYEVQTRAPSSVRYWHSFIKKQAINRFDITSFAASTATEKLKDTEAIDALLSEQLLGHGSPSFLDLVIRRFIALSGLQLSPHAADSLTGREAFSLLDCLAMEAKIKPMSLLTQAEGHALFNRANMCTNPERALLLFTEAAHIYDLALQHSPNDWDILLNAAEAWTKICLARPSVEAKRRRLEKLDRSNPLVLHIEHFYMRAQHAASHNAEIRHKYARFLMLCWPPRREKAENEFLRALQFDPTNTQYLMSYVTFLRQESQEEEAAALFEARLALALAAHARLAAQTDDEQDELLVAEEIIVQAEHWLQFRQADLTAALTLIVESPAMSNDDHAIEAAKAAASEAVWVLRDLLLVLPEQHAHNQDLTTDSARLTKLCAKDSTSAFEALVAARNPACLTLISELVFNISRLLNALRPSSV